MGLIAIGDVHGCALTLEALLVELDPQPDDHLVFVGDYVDRGPRSSRVIERLLRMERDAASGEGPACTFIRGNHDQMMLEWVENGSTGLWYENGGLTTLASYTGPEGDLRVPQAHVDFLRRTRLYLETSDYCFVHAGLDPELSVAENLQMGTADTFLWTRRHLNAPHRNWEKTVVCGHTPVASPLLARELIAIDTGCVFTHHPEFGKLSAIRLPELELVMVPNSE